jgi:hypothetical protein
VLAVGVGAPVSVLVVFPILSWKLVPPLISKANILVVPVSVSEKRYAVLGTVLGR